MPRAPDQAHESPGSLSRAEVITSAQPRNLEARITRGSARVTEGQEAARAQQGSPPPPPSISGAPQPGCSRSGHQSPQEALCLSCLASGWGPRPSLRGPPRAILPQGELGVPLSKVASMGCLGPRSRDRGRSSCVLFIPQASGGTRQPSWAVLFTGTGPAGSRGQATPDLRGFLRHVVP